MEGMGDDVLVGVEATEHPSVNVRQISVEEEIRECDFFVAEVHCTHELAVDFAPIEELRAVPVAIHRKNSTDPSVGS